MWYPPKPKTLADAKVTPYYVQDHILKVLYTRGVTRGIDFSELLRLPYSLIDEDLRAMRQNDLLSPVGGSGVGGYDQMDFALTAQGRTLAESVSKRSPYVGPAPVSLEDYTESVRAQKFNSRWVKREHLQAAFNDIVIDPACLNVLGPAINSGGPLFLYGRPGNGKTSISERLARVFRQGMFVPHSLLVDGQIIQFFDEKVHRVVPLDILPDTHVLKSDPRSVDSRWVFVLRPFIIVGGELTLEMLDLIYREGQHCYEAPFQLKANGGVLLVDDFGRQIVSPKDFLNRWIFPLEKNYDFLTLRNGRKVEVPFEQILIFSTNLNPNDLADEAFWRRIRYKIEIPNPDGVGFKKIFIAACSKAKLEFSEEAYNHLVAKYYTATQREFRAVHPRDLVNHICDHISFNGLENRLNIKIIDMACAPYFAEAATTASKGWARTAA